MKGTVLNPRVMAPNRIVWNSEVWEIALSTNSGQIGILPNYAPLLFLQLRGVLRIHHNGEWSAMTLMGGFAIMDNNQVAIRVFRQLRLTQLKQKAKRIEAGLAFKRAKGRLEASNAV